MSKSNLHMLLLFILLLLTTGMNSELYSNNTIMSHYQRLREHLKKDYDVNARPAKHNTNVTQVKVYEEFFNIIEVDEERKTIEIDGIITLIWKDSFLTWDPKNYYEIIEINLPPSEIWTPDIYEIQTESPTSAITQSTNTHVFIIYDGDVYWDIPLAIMGKCNFDYKNYPLDVAECKIKLESWSYRGSTLDVVVPYHKAFLNYFENDNSYWNLKDSHFIRNVVVFGTNVYPIAEMTLQLTRRNPTAQYQLQWITSVIVALLTLCMFWIPADVRQKLTLGCVLLIMLAVALVCIVSTVKVPEVSEILAKPIHVTMFAVVVAVMLEIAVVNLRYIQDYEPPEFIIGAFSGIIGRILVINSAQPEVEAMDKIKLYENQDEVAPLQKLTKNENWQIVSQIADRLMFIMYILILSVMPKTT